MNSSNRNDASKVRPEEKQKKLLNSPRQGPLFLSVRTSLSRRRGLPGMGLLRAAGFDRRRRRIGVRFAKPSQVRFRCTLPRRPSCFTQLEFNCLATRERHGAGRGARAAIIQPNYTDVKRPHIFRCPAPGRRGGISDGVAIQRTIPPRFNLRHPIVRHVTRIHLNYSTLPRDCHFSDSPRKSARGARK